MKVRRESVGQHRCSKCCALTLCLRSRMESSLKGVGWVLPPEIQCETALQYPNKDDLQRTGRNGLQGKSVEAKKQMQRYTVEKQNCMSSLGEKTCEWKTGIEFLKNGARLGDT